MFAPNLLPSEEDPGWFSIEDDLSMEKAKHGEHAASDGPLENDVNPKAPESKEVPKMKRQKSLLESFTLKDTK